MFSFKFASILISIYVLLPCISADSATFTHSITYKGDSFFDGFNFFTAPDPTHGWVDYVDATTAQQGNLTGVDSSNNVFLRPNDLDVITDPNGKRQSIRIQSKQPFTKGVVIGNFIHMPTGCGTWPAFWASTTGQWPDGGEIDIIEGVNTGEENQSTLHTNPGCTMPSERDQLGQNRKLNCDAKADGNSGCGVGYNNGDSSYGESFNNNGGGWYAMVHDDESIRVFFWKRDDSNVPKDVSNPPESGTITVDDSWGKPYAFFPLGNNCSGDNFGAESIIINTTLCVSHDTQIPPYCVLTHLAYNRVTGLAVSLT
ncbi:glycoside hydrolase family 16 protein [Abortiporus biennis]|nr:glycoside hydrolase family 16 protein [Abortiporus biennis]